MNFIAKTLLPSTNVSHVICGNFRGENNNDLLLVKGGKYLELVEPLVNEGILFSITGEHLFGTVFDMKLLKSSINNYGSNNKIPSLSKQKNDMAVILSDSGYITIISVVSKDEIEQEEEEERQQQQQLPQSSSPSKYSFVRLHYLQVFAPGFNSNQGKSLFLDSFPTTVVGVTSFHNNLRILPFSTQNTHIPFDRSHSYDTTGVISDVKFISSQSQQPLILLIAGEYKGVYGLQVVQYDSSKSSNHFTHLSFINYEFQLPQSYKRIVATTALCRFEPTKIAPFSHAGSAHSFYTFQEGFMILHKFQNNNNNNNNNNGNNNNNNNTNCNNYLIPIPLLSTKSLSLISCYAWDGNILLFADEEGRIFGIFPNTAENLIIYLLMETNLYISHLIVLSSGCLYAVGDNCDSAIIKIDYQLAKVKQDSESGELITATPVTLPITSTSIPNLTQSTGIAPIAPISLIRIQNLAPIVDYCSVSNATDQDQLFICCGMGNKGSLKIVKSGFGVNHISSSSCDYFGITGMWSLKEKFDDNFHSFLVLSFESSTRIMSISNDVSLEDITDSSGFFQHCKTIHVGLIGGCYLVQVTDVNVNICRPNINSSSFSTSSSSSSPLSPSLIHWVAPQNYKISIATTCVDGLNCYIFLTLIKGGMNLVVLHFDLINQTINEIREIPLSAEPSSLLALPDFLLVASYDETLSVYSLQQISNANGFFSLITTQKIEKKEDDFFLNETQDSSNSNHNNNNNSNNESNNNNNNNSNNNSSNRKKDGKFIADSLQYLRNDEDNLFIIAGLRNGFILSFLVKYNAMPIATDSATFENNNNNSNNNSDSICTFGDFLFRQIGSLPVELIDVTSVFNGVLALTDHPWIVSAPPNIKQQHMAHKGIVPVSIESTQFAVPLCAKGQEPMLLYLHNDFSLRFISIQANSYSYDIQDIPLNSQPRRICNLKEMKLLVVSCENNNHSSAFASSSVVSNSLYYLKLIDRISGHIRGTFKLEYPCYSFAVLKKRILAVLTTANNTVANSGTVSHLARILFFDMNEIVKLNEENSDLCGSGEFFKLLPGNFSTNSNGAAMAMEVHGFNGDHLLVGCGNILKLISIFPSISDARNGDDSPANIEVVVASGNNTLALQENNNNNNEQYKRKASGSIFSQEEFQGVSSRSQDTYDFDVTIDVKLLASFNLRHSITKIQSISHSIIAISCVHDSLCVLEYTSIPIPKFNFLTSDPRNRLISDFVPIRDCAVNNNNNSNNNSNSNTANRTINTITNNSNSTSNNSYCYLLTDTRGAVSCLQYIEQVVKTTNHNTFNSNSANLPISMGNNNNNNSNSNAEILAVERKLRSVAEFSLNDVSLRLRLGKFGNSDAIICATVTGALIYLIPVDKRDFEVLQYFENHISSNSISKPLLGGHDVDAFHSEYLPAKNIVDGDFIGQFFDLPHFKQESVMASFTNSITVMSHGGNNMVPISSSLVSAILQRLNIPH